MILARIFLLSAAALLSGSALAATPEWRTMSVDLPDGSVAHVQYVGDIAPRVTVSMPVVQGAEAAEAAGEPVAYGGIPRARRVIPRPEARLPAYRPAVPLAPPPQFVVAGDAPYGTSYNYSVISTDAEGKVCTQRTEWTSRGPGREPKITHTDTGEGCLVETPLFR